MGCISIMFGLLRGGCTLDVFVPSLSLSNWFWPPAAPVVEAAASDCGVTADSSTSCDVCALPSATASLRLIIQLWNRRVENIARILLLVCGCCTGQPALVGIHVRTGALCWNHVLLPACPCWRHLAHVVLEEDATPLELSLTMLPAPSV